MGEAVYPKTYAVITERRYPSYRLGEPWNERELTVKTGTGVVHDLSLTWKNGRSSSVKFVPGVRVKLYRRPGVNHWNFRKIGD